MSLGKHPLVKIIVHLNDDHCWSRESIADWLDTLPVDLTVKKEENLRAEHNARNDAIDAAALAYYGGAILNNATLTGP